MAKKNALGRGLGALIDVGDEQDERSLLHSPSAVNEIAIKSISGNPFQPRTSFDEEAMNELVQSVEEHGIIQPITVRRTADNSYQLISGERRMKAALKAGLKRIPAFVREAGDENMLELALVENIQREDLDAIEVAVSYARLIEEFELTQEELGGRVGKKRATIANYLRLLNLPVEIQTAIREKKVSMGHARALVGIEDKEYQLEVFSKILSQDLSVRQVEALAKKSKVSESGSETPEEIRSDYEDLREHLSHYFGATIEFKRSNKGSGRIVIPFKSDEDLQRIVSILDKPGK
ncbi:MAG: chromosome partitioning protein ParB [Bacteroidetes bacterium]|nr:MAG: chromosome partitioning protein ParB [Bacteroidota bacterium]RLD95114.1 MAG: chromosome partitioning protein ParB [Bacteroidota bacterium]RLE06394.1 MAG: chromosome partitioning protein ParB [Bacteroidota bacterium]